MPLWWRRRFPGGGNATTGTVDFTAAGSPAFSVASNLTLSSSANGGDSITGQGGSATGGTADIGFAGVGATVDSVALEMDSIGGNGVDGGNATGGVLNLTVGGTASLSGSSISLEADATGGNGTSGTGGIGQGGTAYVNAFGDISETGNVSASADAVGGNGATGGTGFGGAHGSGDGRLGRDHRRSVTVATNGTGGTARPVPAALAIAAMPGRARPTAEPNRRRPDDHVRRPGGDGVNGGNGVGPVQRRGFGGAMLPGVRRGSTVTVNGDLLVTANGTGGEGSTAQAAMARAVRRGSAAYGGNPLNFGGLTMRGDRDRGDGGGGNGSGTGGIVDVDAVGGDINGGAATIDTSGSSTGGSPI